MRVGEFKAWLEGYVDGAGKLPPKSVLMKKLESVSETVPTQWWWTQPSYTAPSVQNDPVSRFWISSSGDSAYNGCWSA